jgi:hypothetical protein
MFLVRHLRDQSWAGEKEADEMGETILEFLKRHTSKHIIFDSKDLKNISTTVKTSIFP